MQSHMEAQHKSQFPASGSLFLCTPRQSPRLRPLGWVHEGMKGVCFSLKRIRQEKQMEARGGLGLDHKNFQCHRRGDLSTNPTSHGRSSGSA